MKYIGFDIETIANEGMTKYLPEVIASRTLKDPVKIEADIAKKKQAQIDKMALDPKFGRIACASFMSDSDGLSHSLVQDISDIAEKALIEQAFEKIYYLQKDYTLVTWNGRKFDIPYLYKRACILGITIPEGVDTYASHTTRYGNSIHMDIMEVEAGYSIDKYISLDTAAKVYLGISKEEFDVTAIKQLLLDGKSKEVIERCEQDASLTYELAKKFQGYLI